LAIDDRLGRHVAPSEVLGKGTPDQLPVHAGVERFHGPRPHAAGSSANSSFGSLTSPKVKSRMCVAAWKSRAAGPSPENAAGSTALLITAFVGFFSSDLMRRTSASASCVASRTASARSSAPFTG